MASASGARRLGVARCSPPLFRRPTLPQFLRSWFRSRFSRQARSPLSSRRGLGFRARSFSSPRRNTCVRRSCRLPLQALAKNPQEVPSSILLPNMALSELRPSLSWIVTFRRTTSFGFNILKKREVLSEGFAVLNKSPASLSYRYLLEGEQEFFVFRWFQERFHVGHVRQRAT